MVSSIGRLLFVEGSRDAQTTLGHAQTMCISCASTSTSTPPPLPRSGFVHRPVSVSSAPIRAAPKGLARTLEADIPVGASVDRNGWFADLPACPASPRRDIQPKKLAACRPPPNRSPPFSVLGSPNVTAQWRVLLLPWIGQWILAGIRSCGQAPRLSRKRACHDDASVQQGQVDNPGATSAPVHLTSCRGPAWANTAKCCAQ